MIKIGEINKLKVLRKKDYGYFLDGQTKEKSDDILLPNQNIVDESSINLNQELEVFIYKDSQNRLIATQKKPKAMAGQVAILEVCDNSEIMGAVAGARQVHTLAKYYGVAVILHTDHAARKLLPWIDGLIQANRENKVKLFTLICRFNCFNLLKNLKHSHHRKMISDRSETNYLTCSYRRYQTGFTIIFSSSRI